MKVLIIQQKMIGDVLTSSILFEALKEKYPFSELHYLINSHTFPVVQNNPFIDDYVFLTPEIEKNKFQLLKFSASLRERRYDVIIDVYSKLSSNLISILSNAKIKISYQKRHRNFIYTHNIIRQKHDDQTNGLEIKNRLSLLKPLDINVKSIKPKIYLTKQEIDRASWLLNGENIDLSKPLFMMSVLGSSENKTYPPYYMAKLIDVVVKKTHAQILFNYIPNQHSEAKKVFDFCKTETKKHIHFDILGKDLREFLAITSHCHALIGNEGGAVNMAKALNIPTFSIFCPWIDKNGWNMFEDDSSNVSVHLIDFKPELYGNDSPRESKKIANVLYENFPPEYIIPKLKKYLNSI